MKKIFSSSKAPFVMLAVLVLVNILAYKIPLRIDLTSEKRYSLSAPARSLLKNMEEPVTIEVFLKGEFPAVFRKLQNSTNDLLADMKAYAGNNLNIKYIDAENFIPEQAQLQLYNRFADSLRMMGYNIDSIAGARPGFQKEMIQQIVSDSLKQLGILPYNLKVQQKENESSQRLIFPSALVRSGNRVIPIDLLSGKTEYTRDAVNGRLEIDEAKSISNAEALLEFKFTDAIEKIQRKQKPAIGYLIGNGQPMGPETYDLVQLLEPDFNFSILDPNKNAVIPKELAAVLIVKPSIPFSDSVKMKIDQYIMQGGNVLWFLDMLHAEKDSLAITAQTLAYDRNLNLDDLLFRYGVRINRDLLQDLQCDASKMVVGTAGGEPQLADVPFNYYPLLNASSKHPVTKNLEPVLGQFVNTIDTVEAKGITKSVLLTSSENAKVISTPAIISLNELKTIENPGLYTKKNLPAAILLEGIFKSFYANRASAEMRNYFTQYYGSFLIQANKPVFQLVMADGDAVLNSYTSKEPFSMGYSRVQEHSFSNRNFLQNTLQYITGNALIVALRNKDVTLRLLNKEKLETERLKWQLITIAVPMLLLFAGGLFFTAWRKRKYGSTKTS
jgi:ABC-2 type transport system permease protein